MSLPAFDAKRFLCRLSRRRGAARTRFVQDAVWAHVGGVLDHQVNWSRPVEGFNPAHEYCGSIEYHAPDRRVQAANLLRALANAIVCLPPGTAVSLRSMVPADYGRRKGAAWYRNYRTTEASPCRSAVEILTPDAILSPPTSSQPSHVRSVFGEILGNPCLGRLAYPLHLLGAEVKN